MFLSIATTHAPATDLGFLLHKHPDRLHEAPLSFGRAVMAYPRADEAAAEFVLALDIDPVALVRGRGEAIAQYVNDRPYAASSFLSVAIAKALGTALNGRCKQRPELVETAIPLTATVAPLPLRGDPGFVRRLFEPLGWTTTLDASDGAGYGTLHLAGTQRLADLLTHIYVLVPVLDRAKHYWVGPDEVDKLLARGGEWLAHHPERERIVHVYLKGRRGYVADVLERLADSVADPDADLEAGSEADAMPDPATEEPASADPEGTVERPQRLWERRYDAVLAVLHKNDCANVADIGCAEGKLTARLARDKTVRAVLAIDASSRALEYARARLDRLPETVRNKVQLAHGALGYRDRRLDGIDAALLIEVIEHLDPERIPLATRALFASRPRLVVMTTPNREHNTLYGLDEGALRHPDHRFEWTRGEFEAWSRALAETHGYAAEFRPVGDVDPEHGPPTQMAVLTRGEA